MQVYSYVGKRASVRSLGVEEELHRRTSVKKSLERPRSTTVAQSRPIGAINGYSPALHVPNSRRNVQTFHSEVKRTDAPVTKKSAKKRNPYSLIQTFFSLGILAIVPYFVFGFLNQQMDSRNLTPLVFANVKSSNENPAIADFSVLDGVISDALDGELSRFAYSLSQNDTEFDENGNIVLSDGTILSADSVNPGTPVEWTTYTVGKGDTIGGITYKFGLGNISTLIAVNGIENVRNVWAGQKLRIPSQDGLTHLVSSGESLNSISVKYHVSVEEILDANDLNSEILRKGQELFIPGAKMDNQALRNAMGETFASPLASGWRLTSHFGNRIDPISGVRKSHTGIDMAMPKGTTIKAAMGRKVIKATYSPIFGYYVVIDHGNGYQSLYGHMTKYVVKSGQYVSQGQRIGYVGSTGYSTGPHLHFTVYKNGKLVDPLPLIK